MLSSKPSIQFLRTIQKYHEKSIFVYTEIRCVIPKTRENERKKNERRFAYG